MLLSYFLGSVFLLLFFLIVLLFSFRKSRKLLWLEKQRKPKRQTRKSYRFLNNEERSYISRNMYILFWVAVIMSGVTLVILMNNFLLFFVTLALGVVSIKGYVFTQKRKLRDRIKDQLGPALQTIGSSYQAQKNWLYALRSVTPMLQEPVKGEIERVQRQHETGMSITDAFKQMQKDLNLPELQLFITMVEISQQSGSEVAEGIITAGAYFQQRKIKMQELANAMMSGLSENRILTYAFIGIVVGFRLFKEDMFRGFTHTLLGQILLAFFMSIAVLCLFVSMKISRKEM